MEKKPFEENSATQQELNIWAASQNYIRGEIDVDEFEQAEYPGSQNFRQANLDPTHKKYASLSVISLSTVFLIFIFISFMFYIYTKDQIFIISSAIASYPLILVLERYFSKKR